MAQRVVITGAFSYIGAAVARELGARGATLHTLTNREAPADATFGSTPLRFEGDHLASALAGADVFVNTFWIRLPYAGQTFETAVERSRVIFDAARKAGVGRIVHVSVSNPDQGRNLGYYDGKARVEEHLRAVGVPYAIVRPTLVVGPNDVLTNNIVWMMRRFPFFPVPRGGDYRLQPVTLADTARIVADAIDGPDGHEVDAAGPDVVTFRQDLRHLARVCGIRRWMPATPNWFAMLGIRTVEPFLRDILLTHEELLGLQQELLLSREPPLGRESALDWLEAHAASQGCRYVNDLDRHFRRGRSRPVLGALPPAVERGG